jgi:hypothetical protein
LGVSFIAIITTISFEFPMKSDIKLGVPCKIALGEIEGEEDKAD